MGVNLEIRVRTVGGNRLVADYAKGETALSSFFPGHPFTEGAYRRKAEEVRGRFDETALEQMAEAVRPLSDAASDKLGRISRGDGFFVTTGQQPGLFGGPLYTVHKALSAVALAERLEALLEAPVLPVFWTASDDHDWDEAKRVGLLDTANDLHWLELEGSGDSRLSMGRRALDDAAGPALDALADLLPPSDFTPAIMDRLRSAYGAGSGETVAGAFTRTVGALFDGLCMGLVDSQDPALRQLAVPVLRRELEHGSRHEAALARQTERLETVGYDAQVPILPGASNVFYEDAEGRERLLREPDEDGPQGEWTLRASRRTFTDAELWERFEASPERFSPNVVLRPVVESAVFPTLAYVAGPGEIRYLAQTGCLFEAHDVGMPVVFPRLSVTLVERKVAKVLEKFGLSESDFLGRPVHEVISSVVRDDVPEPVQAAVGEVRKAIQQRYQDLFEAAQEIDPTLKGPIFQARNEGFKAVADVEKKIRQHVKLKEETELEQIEKAAVNLVPDGKPQERVLNVHQYLARYGEELVPAILERMTVSLDSNVEGWNGVRCD